MLITFPNGNDVFANLEEDKNECSGSGDEMGESVYHVWGVFWQLHHGKKGVAVEILVPYCALHGSQLYVH